MNIQMATPEDTTILKTRKHLTQMETINLYIILAPVCHTENGLAVYSAGWDDMRVTRELNKLYPKRVKPIDRSSTAHIRLAKFGRLYDELGRNGDDPDHGEGRPRESHVMRAFKQRLGIVEARIIEFEAINATLDAQIIELRNEIENLKTGAI